VRQLDEVRDGAVGDPVDQVADRTADQHAGRKPQPGPVRVQREVAQQQRQRGQGEHQHQRPPAREDAERHPSVADVDQVHPRQELLLLTRRDPGGDRVLGHLIESQDDPGDERGPGDVGHA
jgi:hypothetical protein